MKRVVEVPVDESLAVTYDRDAFVRAAAEAAPSVFLSTSSLPCAAVSHANVEVLANLPIRFLYNITQAIEADVFAAKATDAHRSEEGGGRPPLPLPLPGGSRRDRTNGRVY